MTRRISLRSSAFLLHPDQLMSAGLTEHSAAWRTASRSCAGVTAWTSTSPFRCVMSGVVAVAGMAGYDTDAVVLLLLMPPFLCCCWVATAADVLGIVDVALTVLHLSRQSVCQLRCVGECAECCCCWLLGTSSRCCRLCFPFVLVACIPFS